MSDLAKITKEYDLFLSSISDDPIGTVLRFHLLTEYYLEQVLRVALPRGDKLVESSNYSYAQKLGIVEATDALSDELRSCLRNLNKLRNRCSHQLNIQITDSDLETIGSPLGKTWTRIKRKDFEVANRMKVLFGHVSAGLTSELEDIEQLNHGKN